MDNPDTVLYVIQVENVIAGDRQPDRPDQRMGGQAASGGLQEHRGAAAPALAGAPALPHRIAIALFRLL